MTPLIDRDISPGEHEHAWVTRHWPDEYPTQSCSHCGIDRGDFEHDQRADRMKELTGEAIVGRGDFWPTGAWPHGRPQYDAEQELRVFEGVRAAVGAIGLTDEERWKVLWRVVAKEIDEYVTARTDE